MIIGQYSVDGQLPKHYKQWNKVWLPFCARKGIDPYTRLDRKRTSRGSIHKNAPAAAAAPAPTE